MRAVARFVPKDKLSKKARKELNRQKRVTWEFSPVTKTVESRKKYNRRKNSYDRYEDYGTGVFLCDAYGCFPAQAGPSIRKTFPGQPAHDRVFIAYFCHTAPLPS